MYLKIGVLLITVTQTSICLRVLLTSILLTLFNDSQLRKYLLKTINTLIFDALNVQVFIIVVV